jgi:hypothetical protein
MRQPVAPRFWAKVEQRGEDECWPWKGAGAAYGAARFKPPGRTTHVVNAQRMAAHLGDPTVPLAGRDVVVTTTCGNSLCVNPRHLRILRGEEYGRMLVETGARAGERSGNARLAEVDVLRLRLWRHSGVTLARCADEFGVAVSQVCRVARGRCWKDLPLAKRAVMAELRRRGCSVDAPAPTLGGDATQPSPVRQY